MAQLSIIVYTVITNFMWHVQGYYSNYYDCRYYYKFSSGDYTVLYNILDTYDLFSYLWQSLAQNAVVPDAMEQAIHHYIIKKSELYH